MSQQDTLFRCRRCEAPFTENDVVQGLMRTKFHHLPSKRVIAVDKPHHCEWLEHVDCDHPKEPYDYEN